MGFLFFAWIPPLSSVRRRAALITTHHSLTHHSLTLSLTHSRTHSLTHSTPSLTHGGAAEPSGGAAARVGAAGPRLAVVWQVQYRVAGAVHRASWRSCGARGRRWGRGLLSRGRRSTQSLLEELRRAWPPLGPRPPFAWQAQHTEPPGGVAARVAAAGAAAAFRVAGAASFRVAGAAHRASWRSCGARGRRWGRGRLSRGRRSTQSLLEELRVGAAGAAASFRVAGAAHRASWRSWPTFRSCSADASFFAQSPKLLDAGSLALFYFSTWYERTPLSFEAVPVQPLFTGQKLCCVHGVTLLKNGVMRHCGTFGTLLQQQSITHRCVAVLLLFLMILVTSADGRWPCDLCQIFVSETGEQRYYLGSLAAANHVKQHNENTDAPISMVLSFCGREMQKIRGQPYEGWEHCFRSANVTHHAWSMDDVKTNHNFRPDVCADMAQQWFTMWIQMCEKLMLYETACAHASLPLTVLFHCFGGRYCFIALVESIVAALLCAHGCCFAMTCHPWSLCVCSSKFDPLWHRGRKEIMFFGCYMNAIVNAKHCAILWGWQPAALSEYDLYC